MQQRANILAARTCFFHFRRLRHLSAMSLPPQMQRIIICLRLWSLANWTIATQCLPVYHGQQSQSLSLQRVQDAAVGLVLDLSPRGHVKARSDRARRRASTRVDAAYLQVMYALSNVCMYPAVNYVIFSYVIALSMTSLAQVLSAGVWHEYFGHLLLLEVQ